MIVVDTSALMAILLAEPAAVACMDTLSKHPVALSAGTLAEVLIVARQRGLKDEIEQLLAMVQAEIVPVDNSFANLMSETYARFGKGNHPAGLNYGDCFAYTLCRMRGWPLLFVGDDFARTDVVAAI